MKLEFTKLGKIVVSINLLVACSQQISTEAEVQSTTQAEQCSETVDLTVAKVQSL